MANVYPFDGYMVFYNSQPPQFEATIQIYQGTTFKGRIGFFADAAPIPNGMFSAGGVQYPSVNYPISRFSVVMEMIHRENPCISLSTLPRATRGFSVQGRLNRWAKKKAHDRTTRESVA